jgi:hypothetical protein
MTNYCLALPYLPGGIEIAKRFAQVEEKEKEEHDEFYKNAGISRESVWIQRGPPGSGAPDLEVLSIETKDPSKTFREFATSKHPWAVKFREYAKKAYGIDFAGPLPPLNEMIVDWKEQE